MFGINRRGITREQLESKLRGRMSDLSQDQIALFTRAIGQATRVIMAKLSQMEKRMSDQIDDLLGAVQAQRTRIDSLVALTQGLHDKVLAAMGDTITPSQAMRIKQVFDLVSENTAAVDAAIIANTDTAAKEQAAGAVTGGPSAADIKSEAGPAPSPSTESEQSGT